MNQINITEKSIDDLLQRQEELRRKALAKESQIESFKSYTWTCVIIGFIVAVVPFICSEELGFSTYGDFTGGTVGAIWALGGIFLIYVAFLGQQQQLLYQQIELIQNQIEMRATQKELKGQKVELEEQNRLFKFQRFETAFFNLLNVQNDINQRLNSSRQSEGDFFASCSTKLDVIHEILNNPKHYSSDPRYGERSIVGGFDADEVLRRHRSANTILEKAQAVYEELFSIHHNELGHYFRHLYHILRFVWDKENESEKDAIKSKIGKEDYQRYADLLQAELSSYQLKTLFYNCLCFPNMKKLVHHYNFLENLSIEDLLDEKHANFFLEMEIDGRLFPKIDLKKRKNISLRRE